MFLLFWQDELVMSSLFTQSRLVSSNTFSLSYFQVSVGFWIVIVLAMHDFNILHSIVVACRLNIRCMCTQTKIHILCNFLYDLWKYEKDDAENVHTMLDIYCEHLQQR